MKVSDVDIIEAYASCRRCDGSPFAPCKEAIDIAAQIFDATNELIGLREQPFQLQTAMINKSHEPFIHRLPQELSSEIFEMTLSNEVVSEEERLQLTRADIAMPLILGAVCRTWRRVAWSSPRLWKSISLVYDVLTPELTSTHLDIASEWIYRSGQYPLSISIYVRQNTLSEYPKQIDRVTRSLVPFVTLINKWSHRWHSLDIQVTNDLISYFTGNTKGPLILEKLRIVDDYLGLPNVFDMTDVAPSPTFLSLTFSTVRMIDFSKLTTVDLNHLSYVELFLLLQIAHRLEHCDVYDIMFPHPHQLRYTAPRFVHESLKVFQLDTLGQHATRPLFDMLSLPALQRLQFSNYFDDMDFQPLIDISTRCKTWLLTSLSIECGLSGDGLIVDFLQHVPHLEKLDLETDRSRESMDEIAALLRRLANTSTLSDEENSFNTSFLPKLSCLKILTTFSSLEHPIQWDQFADIFEPISDIGNANRRPLLSLSVERCGAQEVPPYPPVSTESLITELDTQRFLKIALAGVSLHLVNRGPRGQYDVLQLSIAHHSDYTE